MAESGALDLAPIAGGRVMGWHQSTISNWFGPGWPGWLVSGHVPDALTVAGMAVITTAGVLVALRSARRKA